jgi:hypothetical protein
VPDLPRQHPRTATCHNAHVAVTGEPVAGKLARRVRAGGRWKRTCTTGTSPAAYRCCMRSVRADCYVTYQIRSFRSANIRVSRG